MSIIGTLSKEILEKVDFLKIIHHNTKHREIHLRDRIRWDNAWVSLEGKILNLIYVLMMMRQNTS